VYTRASLVRGVLSAPEIHLQPATTNTRLTPGCLRRRTDRVRTSGQQRRRSAWTLPRACLSTRTLVIRPPASSNLLLNTHCRRSSNGPSWPACWMTLIA